MSVFARTQHVIDSAKEMLCDAGCVDYDKGCVIREQNHPKYCWGKKRRKKEP